MQAGLLFAAGSCRKNDFEKGHADRAHEDYPLSPFYATSQIFTGSWEVIAKAPLVWQGHRI